MISARGTPSQAANARAIGADAARHIGAQQPDLRQPHAVIAHRFASYSKPCVVPRLPRSRCMVVKGKLYWHNSCIFARPNHNRPPLGTAKGEALGLAARPARDSAVVLRRRADRLLRPAL